MNFGHALEAMKQGKKVHRKAWRDTEIYLSSTTLFTMICDDVFADDWEIYEEQLKEPEMTAEHAIENLERDTEPEHKCNACHCNCSHTGTDTNLQEEMKQALSRKFFEFEKYSDDESTVNSMLNIYNSIFPD